MSGKRRSARDELQEIPGVGPSPERGVLRVRRAAQSGQAAMVELEGQGQMI